LVYDSEIAGVACWRVGEFGPDGLYQAASPCNECDCSARAGHGLKVVL